MNPVNNDNFATDFKINLSDDFDYKKEFNSYEPNPENINNKHFEDNDAENHTLNNSEHEKSISLGIDKPIPPNININIDDPDFKPQEKPIYYQSEDINNPSAAMIAHNLNPDVQPNQNLPKKNKTLQYFKFLLYSTKVEVKLHEFLDILRFGSQTEITLWIISMVLYFNGKFRNIIIFFQVLHVIRGLIGYVIRIYFPKMHEIIESTKADDRTMETMEFNDFIRKIAKEKLIPKIQKASKWIIVYIILTCLCFIIDCINFLYVLSNLDEAGPSLEYRVNKNLVYFTMFMVSFLFICKYNY